MAKTTKKAKQRDIQQDLRESAHKIWLAGLGAVAAAEGEGSKLFRRLVERGEEFEARGKEQVDKVMGMVKEARGKAESTFEKLGDTFDEKVSDALKRLGVPTRDEIRQLTKRVEELSGKIDQLRAAKRESTKPAQAA